MTIEELIDRYKTHCRVYYRKPSGRPTSEIAVIAAAVDRLLRVTLPPEAGPDLFLPGAHLDAHAMDSTVLEHVQELMVSEGLGRLTVNHYIHKIRRMFRWAAQKKLVPASVYADLLIVEPLRMGRTLAPETPGLKPVEWETVVATMACASLKLSTMIHLQWLTGMRSGELVRMQKSRIRQCRPNWIYSPEEHKTQHHGKTKTIKLGPEACALLRSWWPRVTGDWLFEGETPAPAPAPAPGKQPNSSPMGVGSYRQAVKRASRRANVPDWVPHQQRHAFATRVRSAMGLDKARAMLGHSDVKTTEIYAEADASLMDDFMSAHG